MWEYSSKGVRWLSWDKMCMTKNKCVFGFRSLYGFNLALLGKHVWNFLSNQDSLIARTFKAWYYPDNHLLKAQKGSDASFIWTRIYEAKEELCKGFKWVLRDGRSINIFSNQWSKGKNDYKVKNHHVNSNKSDKVYEYFRPNIIQWDVTKVHQTFHDVDVRCILLARIPHDQVQDRVAWMNAVNGRYTAQSGCHY